MQKRSFAVLASMFLYLLMLSCDSGNNPTTSSGTVTDIDGNVYHTVSIGKQVWMVENLKTTRFNDGSAIPLVTDPTAWSNLTTLGYCWFLNDGATYKSTYGALYNWYTVTMGNLAPTGWHVPTDSEWTVLITFLGGDDEVGNKLKETGTTHWVSNADATNDYGFAALPGGYRSTDGSFRYVGLFGYWWSATTSGAMDAWDRNMSSSYTGVDRNNNLNQGGLSVRCLRDN
jgi:uncharacterized protein (TIGR02145 family)